MKCLFCGHNNRAGVSFCERCGTSLQNATPRVIYTNNRRLNIFNRLTACLNLLLVFAFIAGFIAAVLFFLCILKLPSASEKNFLPSSILNLWGNMHDWQSQNCGRDRIQSSAMNGEKDEENLNPIDGDEDACNHCKFLSETIPDHTEFSPGEAFTKTWVVRNAGSCTWTKDYYFQITQGDPMGGFRTENLKIAVEPGDQYLFALDLKAPDSPGTYTGRWEIHDDEGSNFCWLSIVIDVVTVPPPEPPKEPPALVDITPSVAPFCQDIQIDFWRFEPNEIIDICIHYPNYAGLQPSCFSETTDSRGYFPLLTNSMYLEYEGEYLVEAKGSASSKSASAKFSISGGDPCDCKPCAEF